MKQLKDIKFNIQEIDIEHITNKIFIPIKPKYN